MGLFFSNRPKPAYVPPSDGGRPTLLGNPNAGLSVDPSPSTTSQRTAVIRNLPGWGQTYLDSEFAPKVDAFIQNARDSGVELRFTSGYRTPERQKELRDAYLANGSNGTGIVAAPAEKSRHSTGLAVDVNYSDYGNAPATQKIIRDAAQKAGLSWGGAYGDPVHFEYIPPDFDFDRYVENFSKQVKSMQP
jgi:hypothetical protein